tara:strand:+ start:211 stop:567 length:357 start_codon:yes stop_codon:yes gene_type:complete
MAFKMKGVKFDIGEKFVIDRSNIDGQGVIASQNIKKGELIGTAITDEAAVIAKIHRDTRTRLGQNLNHQDKENAIQKSENNALNVYAKNSISEGEEITINYINAPDYIDKSQVAGYKT